MKSPWLLVLLGLSACSWLIDPESQPTRCAIGKDLKDPCGKGLACVKGACIARCVLIEGEPDPCAEGQQCVQGVCTESCQDSEICNDGIDNDCDGSIDEADPEAGDLCGDNIDNDCDGNVDEGHDQDGDGNTWCGDPNRPNGGGIGDCDEKDPNVFYGADERCDGVDNDCDGVTDETSAGKSLCEGKEQCLGQRCVVPSCAIPEAKDKACGPDEMCDVETGTCVAKLCDETECNQLGEYCDQGTGECRTVRKDNGEACAAHSDCKSQSCIESAALRLTVTAPRVCMQTCCADTDCETGERCFASGTGARSCLPIDKVPVPAGAAQLCTLDNQCAAGQSCAVVKGQDIMGPIVESRTNLVTGACRTIASGDRGTGQSCGFAGAVCASQACVLAYVDFFSASFVCSQTCRNSTDCGAVADSPANISNRASYCRFLTTSSTSGGDYVPVCVVAGNEVGSGNLGARCASGSNCKDGACVGASPTSTGSCATTCCNDSQCGNLGEVTYYCRPVAFGGDHYETRCVP